MSAKPRGLVVSTRSSQETVRRQLKVHRERIREALPRAVVSGTSAAVCSAAALALLGKLTAGTAAGPLNGPTQMLLGERAARDRSASLKTVAGVGLHHLIAIGWATLHEAYVAPLARGRGPGAKLLAGVATAAITYGADYGLARGRLRPGFEKHLGLASRIAVYSALAVGLAIPSLLKRR
jgi:GNAT superfamily N-acetyltransferase